MNAGASNGKFTIEERIFLLRAYFSYNADYQTIFHEFTGRFPNCPVPQRQMVWNLYRKFLRTGSVADAPRCEAPVTVSTEENLENVALSLEDDANQSARRLSTALGFSDRTLRRMLKKLKDHVYRPRLVHALHEDDFDRRMEFCEWYRGCSDDDPQFYRTILWTDEATFELNGTIDRHNCVYWATENPNVTVSQELNLPGVCVWAGIHANGLVGPYFFEGTVTGDSYLELLVEVRGVLDADPTLARIEHFQQDGAPPHRSHRPRVP